MTDTPADRLRALVAEVHAHGFASVHRDGDALDALEAVLRQVAKGDPTHIHLRFDEIELTVPLDTGADNVILDEDPGAEAYRFNPRGIVVNKARLRGVRLLTPFELDEMGIGADSQVNERAAKEA